MDVFLFDGQRATLNIKEKKKQQQLSDAQRLLTQTKQKTWEKAEVMCVQLLLKSCWIHKWFDVWEDQGQPSFSCLRSSSAASSSAS